MKDPETGKWKVPGPPRTPFGVGGFFSNLFPNRDQDSSSGLQNLLGSNLLGSSALTQARYYDEDHKRKWRERFGTGQERTNLDAPQTGLSAAQINLRPGLKGNRVTPGMFGSAIDFMTGKVSQKTNNPAEVAGLGNVVSDPDGSMYGTDSSPALADYMLPQEQGQTLKEEEVFNPNQQFLGGIREGEDSPWSPGAMQLRERINEQRTAADFRAGKLNENISGNIYAKHGGSVFRNAYDQASNIMHRAKGGGLEGLRESIDINGQPHNLAYINPTEANLLKVLGGAGKEVNGVPAYWFGWDEGGEGQSSNGDSYADAGPGDAPGGVEGGRGSPEYAEQPGERADQAALDALMSDPGFAVSLGSQGLNIPNAPENWGEWEDYFDKSAKESRSELDARIKMLGKQMGGLRGKTDAYFDMPSVQALDRDATDEEIAAALRDAQLDWWAAVTSPAAKGRSDEYIMGLADKYGQEYGRSWKEGGGYHAAQYVLATGFTEDHLNTIKNTAKEAKEQKTEDIREELKLGPDLYADKPMDLDELMDLNEMYVEQAQKDAVISSMLGQEGVENFIPYDPGKGVLQLAPGLYDTIVDMVTGKKSFNVENTSQAILSTIMSKAGWGFIDAAAWVSNFIGDIMGEQVIGTVEVNGITMNLHESGNLTFASPEDAPGYDASGEGEGGDTSGLKAVKRERLPVEEEEEDKSTRSIADLVKKSSPGTGTDSLVELYQSIYGPDVTPFNVST